MRSSLLISILGAAPGNLARPLVRVPIDETQRTTLRGKARPLAQARYNQGVVTDSFPADRVLMLLNRPPERESALRQFLAGAHLKAFPNYRHWLTPLQFGEEFGPADSDVQAVNSWLGAKGFKVAEIAVRQTRRTTRHPGGEARVSDCCTPAREEKTTSQNTWFSAGWRRSYCARLKTGTIPCWPIEESTSRDG
jgi:hypothetical protein